MTPYGIAVIITAVLSVQIMQTSTQLHVKKYRCFSSLRPLPQPVPRLETRTPIPESQTAPSSKSLSSAVSVKSSDSALKSPSAPAGQKTLPASVSKSPNPASRFSSDSFSLFKVPLQLISSLLIPLLPPTTKQNTSTVISPQVNVNIPLTISTIHSSNYVPCKTATSLVPGNDPIANDVNTPNNHHEPYNTINNSPTQGNTLPGSSNTSPIPCNPHQKNPYNRHHTFMYTLLCNLLKMIGINVCADDPPNTQPDGPFTSSNYTTNKNNTTTTPDTTGEDNITPMDTITDDTTTTDDNVTTTIGPKGSTKKPSPAKTTTPTCTTKEPIQSTSTTSKYTTNKEPNSSTTTTSECTSNKEPVPPCTSIPMFKICKQHKPHLSPMHIPTLCKLRLPPTSSLPVICRHNLVLSKLYPPNHSSCSESSQDNCNPIIDKPNDFNLNSQELLIKLLTILTSNLTSSISQVPTE